MQIEKDDNLYQTKVGTYYNSETLETYLKVEITLDNLENCWNNIFDDVHTMDFMEQTIDRIKYLIRKEISDNRKIQK